MSAVKGRFTTVAAEMTAAGRPRPRPRPQRTVVKRNPSKVGSRPLHTPALACPWCCSTSPHDPNGHSALLVMCALQNKALIDRHAVKKSVNLHYNTLGRLDDGTNESLTKCLMFQVLFSFMISCKILCKNQNLLSYFFIELQK